MVGAGEDDAQSMHSVNRGTWSGWEETLGGMLFSGSGEGKQVWYLVF